MAVSLCRGRNDCIAVGIAEFVTATTSLLAAAAIRDIIPNGIIDFCQNAAEWHRPWSAVERGSSNDRARLKNK